MIAVDGTMTDAAMWAVIVGFLSPLIISLVQQPSWSNMARSLVTFGYSIVVGAVTAYLNGALEGRSLVSTILLVMVTAIASYQGFWKDAGARRIEQATSKKDVDLAA